MSGFFSWISEPSRVDAALAALGPAIVGGLLPTLVWLAFWLREDREHPEPRRVVFTTFLLGAATIPAAAVLQKIVADLFLGGTTIYAAAEWAPAAALATLAIWVTIEEVIKVVAAYAGGLSRRESDEPIDSAVYLIAAALGFSAAENFLYVFTEIIGEELPIALAIVSGSTRAVGATTLHVAAAAVLGVFAGYARYATPRIARWLWASGLTLVTLLHLAYNALIIFGGKEQSSSAAAFAISWTVSLAAILALEKVKSMRVESGARPEQEPND